jgi:hypothetical protein
MTIAVPFLDARTGLVEGVLVAEARVKEIRELIADVQVGPGQSVYIVNAQGGVVVYRDPSVVLRDTHFDVPDQSGIHPGLTGSRVVLAVDVVRLGEQTFYVIAEQTVSEAPALAIDSMVIIVVMILAACYFSRWPGLYDGPADRPTHSGHSHSGPSNRRWRPVAAGANSGQDELGVLARAFNSMTGQLRTLIHDLEEEVAERQRTGETLKENIDVYPHSGEKL